ncbi:MAG: DNA/RNA non-specific endonuclease [Verrucomicrobiota bacterium]
MKKVLICIATLLLSAALAEATTNVTSQMQLGNPSSASANTNNHDHYLIQRTVEAIDYSDNFGEPNWASWDLTASDLGSSGRNSSFYTDTNLPPNFYRVSTDDYSGSGYDRGHMCPSADRTISTNVNKLVFFMSNIIPQAPDNNEAVWEYFESYCRTLAQSGNELLIICGPSGFNGSLIHPSQRVFIPAYTWKIVVVGPSGCGTNLSMIDASTRVISLKIPNSNSVSSSWQNYITSARQIEVDTGFTFFTALPSDVASALRDKVDGQTNPPPVITGFLPTSGAVNDSVVITGTNFTSASAVTFNGVSGAFAVNSATQITATVPTNATSGLISVTTPTGTALSSNSFTVTGSTVDLAITKTHFGNFSQGDTGDTYTINVANIGNLASTGTITVTDALPAGLTATSIGGIGWTANLSTLTCTRSNTLYAGASYPPITVTVNVSASAPASVTNTATVSGGGDANSANNTASDATTINASAGSGNAITLVGWDVSGLPGGSGNYGPSPLSPTTNVPTLTIGGLTRGSGVGTGGTAAARAWGGNAFTGSDAATAITSNQFATFMVTAVAGYRVSYASISKFDYRRSSTGPANGVLQYQIGSGAFSNITSLSYSSSSSSGASLNPINLTGFSDLQNVGPGTNVTFRIVNYGGGSSGTWYVFDVAISSAPDLVVQGTVSLTNAPDLVISKTHAGNFTQGDTGDAYTITVTNNGNAATVGTVSVVDALPAGFTATAISGAGWTTDLGTLTCTRSESLAAGAGYPPITVIVDVATNAASNVTNTASVSGGGEINTANDAASDPTTVIALNPIQLWRLQWFGITGNTGAAADNAIASSDGMPNLLKYALGLAPFIPAANPVVGDISTGYLRLTSPKNPDATDITFLIEMTGDLTTLFTTNGITIDQNTATLLQGHDNTPVNSSTCGFMRLHVTRP